MSSRSGHPKARGHRTNLRCATLVKLIAAEIRTLPDRSALPSCLASGQKPVIKTPSEGCSPMLFTIAAPSVDSVVAGNGKFLHTRWIHSHPADIGPHRRPDSGHSRPQPGVILRPLAASSEPTLEVFHFMSRYGKNATNILRSSTSHCLCRAQKIAQISITN